MCVFDMYKKSIIVCLIDICNFTRPLLAYLRINHDNAVEDYVKSKLMELSLDGETMLVFVPKAWK